MGKWNKEAHTDVADNHFGKVTTPASDAENANIYHSNSWLSNHIISNLKRFRIKSGKNIEGVLGSFLCSNADKNMHHKSLLSTKIILLLC